MQTINRAAIVVRLKEPSISWAGKVDDAAEDLAENLRGKTSVYLVAQDSEGQEESAPIELHSRRILESELEAWSLDEYPRTTTPRWLSLPGLVSTNSEIGLAPQKSWLLGLDPLRTTLFRPQSRRPSQSSWHSDCHPELRGDGNREWEQHECETRQCHPH